MIKKNVYLLFLVIVCSIVTSGCGKKNKETENITKNQTDTINNNDSVSEINNGNQFNNGEKINNGNGLTLKDLSVDEFEVINEEQVSGLEDVLVKPVSWSIYYRTNTIEDGTFSEITKINNSKELDNFTALRPNQTGEKFSFNEDFYKENNIYLINILNPYERQDVKIKDVEIINGSMSIKSNYFYEEEEHVKTKNEYILLVIENDTIDSIKDIIFYIGDRTQEDIKNEIKEKQLKTTENIEKQ